MSQAVCWLHDEALNPANIQARLARLRAQALAECGPDSALTKRRELEKLLAANTAAMERLLAEAIRGRFPEAFIDTQQRALEAEERRLRQQITQLEVTLPTTPELSDDVADDLQSYVAIIREGLVDLTPTERRHVIDMLDTRLVLEVQDGAVVNCQANSLRCKG